MNDQSINQPMQHYRIEGVLRTLTPLHITDASRTARWVPDAGKIAYNDKEGFPLTLTRAMPIYTESILNEEGQANTIRNMVPVIPASTWRGALRREASKIIEAQLSERGEKLSYQAYMSMRCGAVSGKPEGTQPTTDETLRARRNVFYGLFGGGPRMLRSYLRVSDSLPVTSSLIHSGTLPEYLTDEALQGVTRTNDLFVIESIVRKDDFSLTPEEAREVVKDFDATADAIRSQYIEQLKKKGKKGSKDVLSEDHDDADRGVRTLSFRQDVAIGVPFFFRARLYGTQAQVGMIIAALEHRLSTGIGGRAALGFGQLGGTIKIIPATGNPVKALSYDGLEAQIHDEASPYMEALHDEVSRITLDEIESYVIPGKTKKKKGEEQ